VDRVYCPYCRHPDSRVIDSRTAEDGAAIRRRRSCPACGRRFTTQETVILMVGKRSGVTEPFNRDKIIRGVRRACQGRPVTEDQLAILAQRVEDAIRGRGSGEVPSHEVGLAILGPLRDLDEVAYLRFASVYRGFESLADFEDEIAGLRRERDGGWQPGDEDGARPAAGEPPDPTGESSEPAERRPPEPAERRPPASREPTDRQQRAGAR
jgi:transcriptional repressor NrdR